MYRFNRYRRRYSRALYEKPKKKSISSKIDNLSYGGLLKWELAYKNKINEIETTLNLDEFKRINKRLKDVEKTIPNISLLKDDIKKYKSNFTMYIDCYIHRKFWSPDEGIIIGNLTCTDEKKMDKIISKIKNVRDKWRGLLSFHSYFDNLGENINKFRKELDVEKDISQYYSSDYSGGAAAISDDILNSFYPNTNLHYDDGSQISLTNAFHNIKKDIVSIKNYKDSEKYERCSKEEARANSTVILYLIGSFFEKISSLGIGYITFPKSPPEDVIKKYRDFFLDKSKNHLRKIELKIRSKKRAIELSENENFIYIMSSEDLPKDSYKIGWTSNLPEERAEELSGTSVLHDFKVEYSIKFKDAEKIEKKIHKHFKDFRIRKNKEIFNLKIEKIIEYIESIKENK